jgi:Uma2 family endonuclease
VTLDRLIGGSLPRSICRQQVTTVALILPDDDGIVVVGIGGETCGVSLQIWRRRARPRRTRMTLAEYFETPETVVPQELIFGVMRVAESPTTMHQEAVAAMFLALHTHLQRDGSGQVWFAPLDVVLDADRALVVQPDLLVILRDGPPHRQNRPAAVLDKVYGAPDLVIEVMSPNPRIGTLAERLGWFAKYGVRECWLVHPVTYEIDVWQFADDSTHRRRPFGPDERIVSGVLPDFDQSPVRILGYPQV